MATCCFLPRRSDLCQLDHDLESKLKEIDSVTRNYEFLKLPSFISERNGLPNKMLLSPDITSVTIDTVLGPYFQHNDLDCGSDKMSSMRETSLSAEAGLVSSGSVKSGKEEDCDSSCVIREEGETSISTKQIVEVEKMKDPGLSRKRGRIGDADFRMLDTATESSKDQNTFNHVLQITRSGNSTSPPGFLTDLSSHNNDSVYYKANPSWMKSFHSTSFPHLTPTHHHDFNSRGVSQEGSYAMETCLKEGNLIMRKPEDYSSYGINIENAPIHNALMSGTYTANKHPFTGSVSPHRETEKRLMLQSQDVATARLSSISFSSQDVDSSVSAKNFGGCKDMTSESFGREETRSFDWSLSPQGSKNVSGMHIGSGPIFHQQGTFLSAGENMQSGGFSGMPSGFPFTSQMQFSKKLLQGDYQTNKSSFESPPWQLGNYLQVKRNETFPLQVNSPESLVQMLNSTSQLPTLSPPSTSAQHADWYRSGLQFMKPHEYHQSSLRSKLPSNNILATCSSAPLVPSQVGGHALQSLDAAVPVFPYHSNMPLSAHSQVQYLPLNAQDPAPIRDKTCQDGSGNPRALSERFQSMGALLQSSFDLNPSPAVTVVMEGRSIGRSLCLYNYDSYESFAKALKEMFESDFSAGNMSIYNEPCNLENAIPGHVIAYEDVENDLLLAGDLSWRDFLCAAKRIRILPSRINKTKREGDST